MGKKFVIVLGILIITALLLAVKNLQPQENNPERDTLQEAPKIVSTKPDPLDENIITAEQIIEITFNRTVENTGELKIRIEPQIDFKTELSGDRKTARIIPRKPYALGTTYTLFIGPETKFDGVGRWGEEKVFHFRTIQYRGV